MEEINFNDIENDGLIIDNFDGKVEKTEDGSQEENDAVRKLSHREYLKSRGRLLSIIKEKDTEYIETSAAEQISSTRHLHRSHTADSNEEFIPSELSSQLKKQNDFQNLQILTPKFTKTIEILDDFPHQEDKFTEKTLFPYDNHQNIFKINNNNTNMHNIVNTINTNNINTAIPNPNAIANGKNNFNLGNKNDAEDLSSFIDDTGFSLKESVVTEIYEEEKNDRKQSLSGCKPIDEITFVDITANQNRKAQIPSPNRNHNNLNQFGFGNQYQIENQNDELDLFQQNEFKIQQAMTAARVNENTGFKISPISTIDYAVPQINYERTLENKRLYSNKYSPKSLTNSFPDPLRNHASTPASDPQLYSKLRSGSPQMQNVNMDNPHTHIENEIKCEELEKHKDFTDNLINLIEDIKKQDSNSRNQNQMSCKMGKQSDSKLRTQGRSDMMGTQDGFDEISLRDDSTRTNTDIFKSMGLTSSQQGIYKQPNLIHNLHAEQNANKEFTVQYKGQRENEENIEQEIKKLNEIIKMKRFSEQSERMDEIEKLYEQKYLNIIERKQSENDDDLSSLMLPFTQSFNANSSIFNIIFLFILKICANLF